MRTYREEYEYWLASDVVDEKTKEELRALEGKEEEIEGRFKAMLTFGTAGLRGPCQSGDRKRRTDRRRFERGQRRSHRSRLETELETLCGGSSFRTGGKRHQGVYL